MFPPAMTNNSASLSEKASVSSVTRVQDFRALNPAVSTISSPQQPQKIKKKRSLPGNPDPDAEVIALSPKTLLATNRFVCEICSKGFQRDQNLQLHKRGHNLPWKLKQRSSKDVRKRAYVCPEASCVHHHSSRALGDLTGIKKHYCRKHGEKKWKCSKCSKIYAVQSDWRAHSKTCGTREYRCDCGSLFSRKDSFITHRAFCDALAAESAKFSANQLAAAAAAAANGGQALHLQPQTTHSSPLFPFTTAHIGGLSPWEPSHQNPNPNNPLHIKPETENRHHFQIPPPLSSSSSSSQYNNFQEPQPTTRPAFQSRLHVVSSTQPTLNVATSAHHRLPATALLQKAATVGATSSRQAQSMTTGPMRTMTQLNTGELDHIGSASHISPGTYMGFTPANLSAWQKSDRLTRDFLGMAADANGNENVSGGAINVRDVLTYTGGLEFQPYERSVLKPQSFGFAEPTSGTWGDC